MTSQGLYERIRYRDITDVSKNLFYQIEQRGSTQHKMIGSNKQHLFLYAFEAKEVDLPFNMTYEEVKQKFPREFGIHMKVLKECIDAGFKP